MSEKNKWYAKYYKNGKLKVDTRNIKTQEEINKLTEEALNKELWDCPQCGRHTMEQVQFATYSASPDGQPGLLCFHCGRGSSRYAFL
jgi:hypothetical protein